MNSPKLHSLKCLVLTALLAIGIGSTSAHALLPNTIVVTVRDAVDNDPLLDCSVTLTPSAYGAVTENEEGVYGFPSVSDGSYTITVTNPCFPTRTQGVTVSGGQIKSVVFYMNRYGLPSPAHSADTNADGFISLSEELRVIQFYNTGSYHCQAGTEDGFAPGTGSHSCTSHKSDYNPQNWVISLSEVLRLIQFYNSPGYHKQAGTEDGYAPNCVLD